MKKLLVSLIVLMFAAAPVSAQNLVVDGSFEGLCGGGWCAFPQDSTVGAWTALECQSWFYEGEDANPADGTGQIHIGHGYSAGYVSQLVSGFIVGATYELSFAVCAYNAPHTASVRVTNLDAAVDDLPEVTFDTLGSLGSEMLYHSFEFTASNTELELALINPGGYATDYDDVSIVQLTTPVLDIVELDTMTVYEKAAMGPQTARFTVAMLAAPGVNPGDTITVDIDPNSNGNGIDVQVDKGAGYADTVSLTFTDSTWDTPQTITVKAIDDTWADGYEEIDTIGFVATSALGDPSYDDAGGGLFVTIVDDDSAAVLVSPATLSVAEAGATSDTYTVELGDAPTNPVTVIVAAGIEAISATDANEVADPFDCQLTVNGGGSVSLVFNSGNYNTPQPVTVAAVDDSLYETDPHVITIENIVAAGSDSDYLGMSVDVDVSITENDVRGWAWEATEAVPVANYSFEDPCLADGGSVDFGYDPCDPCAPPVYIPDWDFYVSGTITVSNPTAGELAAKYKAGHQQAQDGGQILSFGASQGVTENAIDACTYLIEPGPVSYTFEISVGVPEPNDASAFARLILSNNTPAGGWTRLDDETFTLAGGDLVAGEWVDIKVCGFIDAPDHAFVGDFLSVGMYGSGVDMDNVRLTVANKPCDGCQEDITEAEGDLDDDCDVDLADFAIMAGNYLNCNMYPGCITGW